MQSKDKPLEQFICRYCGKVFLTEQELSEHEKTHIPEPVGEKVTPQKDSGRQ
jgi:hypothetical protein